MFCGISGKPPRFPVLSPVSKCLFEKDLIVQYVQEEGKDPITNSPLALDQLIEISLTPQQSSLTNTVNSSTLNSNYSIPNLLSSLQNEWDALMLENFRLRKQLDSCTKQLSTALYERDAAKIVAAKALKGRAQIVSEMNLLTSQLGSIEDNDSESGDVEVEDKSASVRDLTDAIIERLVQESKVYMEQTRKVVDKFSLHGGEELELKSAWDVPENVTINRTMNFLTNGHRKYVFSTSEPGMAVVLEDSNTIRKVQTTLTDGIEYLSLGSSSDDLLYSLKEGPVGIYSTNGNKSTNLDVPHSKIIFMNQHEYILKDYFLFVDQAGKVILSPLDCSEAYEVWPGSAQKQYHQAALHKDGLLLALVGSTTIELLNFAHPNDAPTLFEVGKQIISDGHIERIEFSSNGYWMIVSCGGSVMSFDLRKETGTLAVNALDISSSQDVSWDIDMSGKNIMVLKGTDIQQNTISLTRFNYKKSKKIWESVPGPAGRLSLDGVNESSSIHHLQLLYDDSSLSVLIHLDKRILLFSSS